MAVDVAQTIVELAEETSGIDKETLEDIDMCLRILLTTPTGSQEGDRNLGIDQEKILDKSPMEVRALLTAEYTEKIAKYEPRVQLVRTEWDTDDVELGIIRPKVVWNLVEN